MQLHRAVTLRALSVQLMESQQGGAAPAEPSSLSDLRRTAASPRSSSSSSSQADSTECDPGTQGLCCQATAAKLLGASCCLMRHMVHWRLQQDTGGRKRGAGRQRLGRLQR